MQFTFRQDEKESREAGMKKFIFNPLLRESCYETEL